MLSPKKLKQECQRSKVSVDRLAESLVRPGMNKKQAVACVKNWQKGCFKTKPVRSDVEKLARVLGVEANDLLNWCSSYQYAPLSARKARLVTQLIVGRGVQDALDILKFTSKRSAHMVIKVLKSAMADADEQQADVENLYVSEARVDDAGIRIGTKRWIPKDRGRAHPIRKKACHIKVAVSQA